MWRLGVSHSYTLEVAFSGSTLGEGLPQPWGQCQRGGPGLGAALVSFSLSPSGGRSSHFSVQDLESLGRLLCDTLLDFCDPVPAKVGLDLAQGTLVPRDHDDTLTLALSHSSSSAWWRWMRCCSGRWVVSQALEAAGAMCLPQSLSPGMSSSATSCYPLMALGAAGGSFPLQHQWL